jgi:hypothetical protein
MVWNMQKSAIEEINELKARLESITERAKAEALDKASEAIGFLRELGLENDTILRELGFRGRTKVKESRDGTPPKEEPCPICNFRTDPPRKIASWSDEEEAPYDRRTGKEGADQGLVWLEHGKWRPRPR